jgi:diadenosine tetraphosphate (Ap4A) HIT family hydrolase
MRRLDKAAALARVAAARRDGCPMCAPLDVGAPVAASGLAIAVLARFAARPGHVMVILRRHAERLAEVSWDEYQALHRLAFDVGRALEAALTPARLYVAALGSAVPLDTSFPHLHLHLVPLADGGAADRPASVFTWSDGVYVFDDADEERAHAARLAAAVARVAPAG